MSSLFSSRTFVVLLAALMLAAKHAAGVCQNAKAFGECLAQLDDDVMKQSRLCPATQYWLCTCIEHQGYLDCASLCPRFKAASNNDFSKTECAGQHGVTIAAMGGDVTYTWSNLSEIIQGASATSNSSNISTRSSATATTRTVPLSTSNTFAPTFTGAESNASMTTTSQANGGATSGANTAAASVVNDVHIALVTVTMSLILAAFTVTLL